MRARSKVLADVSEIARRPPKDQRQRPESRRKLSKQSEDPGAQLSPLEQQGKYGIEFRLFLAFALTVFPPLPPPCSRSACRPPSRDQVSPWSVSGKIAPSKTRN